MLEVTEQNEDHSRFSPRRIPLEIRKAAAVIAIAVVMASSFVAAYTLALGQPFPRNMPVGVVGAAADTAPLIAALQSRPSEFDVHEYPTREAGIAAVNQQRITAVIDATSKPPQLLLSSASDPSGARALTQLDQTQPGQFVLPIVDLHPLPTSDPAGLATFYLVIAATILGFITMFQLRANVKTLSLRRWLACLVTLAVIGGAALSFVAGPVLHALQNPVPATVAADVAADRGRRGVQLHHAGLDAPLGDHPHLGGVHPARQHLIGRGGVGIAAAAAVRVPQPRAAQRGDRLGDPRGDVLPAEPAAAARSSSWACGWWRA